MSIQVDFAVYHSSRGRIFKYFDYVEDWRILPIDVVGEVWWKIVGGEAHGGVVRFAGSRQNITDREDDRNYYEYRIYAQRYLPKWVYRGEEYTMIVADTRTDENKLLCIFKNELEVKDVPA